MKDRVPKNFGRNVTILGTLSAQGLEAVMTVDGAMDAAVFRAYVQQVLVPTLHPGEIVIMDNLGVDKVVGIHEANPAVKPHHGNICTGFIHEFQAAVVTALQQCPIGSTCLTHLGRVAFTSV